MVKKKCRIGWGCGGTCISRKKLCRSNLDQNEKKIVESFTQYVKRLQKTQEPGGVAGPPTPEKTVTPEKVVEPKSLLIPKEDKFTFMGKDLNLRELVEAQFDSEKAPEALEFWRLMRDMHKQGAMTDEDLKFEVDDLLEGASLFGVKVERELATILEKDFDIDLSSIKDAKPDDPHATWDTDRRIPEDLFTRNEVIGSGSFGVFIQQDGQGYKIEADTGYDSDYVKVLEDGAKLQNKLAAEGIAPRVDYVAKGPEGLAVIKMDFLDGYEDFTQINRVGNDDLRDEVLPNLKKAIDKIKELGISHNDLHVGNVMFNPQNFDIKIIDLLGASEDTNNFGQYDKLIKEIEGLLQ